MLLAGDVGATKTTLAMISPEAGPRKPLMAATFVSARYARLEALVRDFLHQSNVRVHHACFGVAAPVIQSRAKFTNLPWVVDEPHLASALNLSSVRLLNDAAAIAHAVPILGASDLHTLSPGEPEPGGARAIIAPGTGLGEAFLTWDGIGYRAYASEGGHADFAPTNEIELALLRHLLKRYEHVSYERVSSGIGFPNIYEFLKESNCAEEPEWLAKQLAAADDPTPVIVNAALDQLHPNSALLGAAVHGLEVFRDA